MTRADPTGPATAVSTASRSLELRPGHLGCVDGAPEGGWRGVQRDQHADPHQGLGPWVEVMDARLSDPRVGHRRDERRVAQRQATECRSGGWARAAAHRRPPVVLPCAWTAPFKPGAGRLASSRWGDARSRGRCVGQRQSHAETPAAPVIGAAGVKTSGTRSDGRTPLGGRAGRAKPGSGAGRPRIGGGRCGLDRAGGLRVDRDRLDLLGLRHLLRDRLGGRR